MNAPRKNKVIIGAASNELDGPLGFLRRQLNNILTVLLVIAAIIMFIRWRMKTAEMNKLAVGNELVNARTVVMRLKQGQIPGSSPADLIKGIQSIQVAADSSISNVLNSSDATASLRGQAFVLRGDLYWYLANLPAMPGSATEATLRLSETPDVLLQKSFDAYSEVVKNSTYADQHESLDAAHLGLGAIAENRGDWKTATAEFQTVINDSACLAVLSDQARFQIAAMPTLQKTLYVAPPTGIGPATMPVASGLLEPLGPALPAAISTTMPTTASTDVMMRHIISATTRP